MQAPAHGLHQFELLVGQAVLLAERHIARRPFKVPSLAGRLLRKELHISPVDVVLPGRTGCQQLRVLLRRRAAGHGAGVRRKVDTGTAQDLLLAETGEGEFGMRRHEE